MASKVVLRALPHVSLALVTALATPRYGEAQQRFELGGRLACEACRIELERLVTLGDRTGEGYVGFPVGVGHLRSGEWLLVHSEHATQIAVFGPDGTFRRRVGRLGSGPGEFRQIMYLAVDPTDSVRIYDALTGRLSILDHDLIVRRSLLLGIAPPTHFIFTEGGGFIASTRMRGVDQLGYPLHFFSREGKYVRSFGAVNPAFRAGEDPGKSWRSIAPVGDGRIRSARLMEYVVELWTAEGALIAEYRRGVDWFKPHEKVGFNGDEPPNSYLRSIHVDPEGRLWTLVRVADVNWRNGVGEIRHPYGHTVLGVTNHAAYYDTILEVFDADTGHLLATRRFPDYLSRFIGDGLVTGYREDAAGYPSVDVFRIHLQTGG